MFFQGADIPDIKVVVQFGAPLSLDIWVQRAGRAGRIQEIQATTYILVEKTAFQLQKPRVARQPKDPPKKGTRGRLGMAKSRGPVRRPMTARLPSVRVKDTKDTMDTTTLEYKKKIDESVRQFLSVPTQAAVEDSLTSITTILLG